jgi:Zn-dependent protease with chaperone function
LWLDRGQIYEFTANPSALEKELGHGLRSHAASSLLCPRCACALERGKLTDQDAVVHQCPQCEGLWFGAAELERAVQASPGALSPPLAEESHSAELPSEADPHAQAAAQERQQALRTGLLALPNLFLRSALVLGLLYGLLGLVLVALAQFDVLAPSIAVGIGVAIILLQFLLGPWFMDLMLRWLYAFDWVPPDRLPEHLRVFVERVCAEERLKFPSFGIIHDGAPQAFTYGHHPNNARVVLSQGIFTLLEPDEVEAVVAHELGHARNWDMALMTLANLVPLLLYYLYRVATDYAAATKDAKENKTGGAAWVVGAGAYVLYIVSQYLVLWFSRTREYYADRFAGRVTNNPNALASGLVKIAYGLAARGKSAEEVKEKKQAARGDRMGALRALNIFDDRAAVGLVMASASRTSSDSRRPDVEQIKGAMQWDLWNPWATFYELHSTHPLVAKRLQHLADQAAHQDQEPLVVFDRRKPESYWDDFLVDLLMLWLPILGFVVGAAAGAGAAVAAGLVAWKVLLLGLGGGLLLAGFAGLRQLRFSYRRDFFPHLSVAALLHRVKVSSVRPVPATLTGTIIGKGVPGLVFSEDFVLQDKTGILFLDYRQPLGLWNFLFGLLRAGRYQGKEVRVRGWYRRAPVPYLQLDHLEVLDGSLPSRRCYTYHAQWIFGVVMAVVGVALMVLTVF